VRFTPTSVFVREFDGRSRSVAPQRIWAITLPQPDGNLPTSNPLITPLGQVLALGNQILMNRTSEHRDAVPADLVGEVLRNDVDGAIAGRTQDIRTR
jgi:hypothetical protein